MKLLKGRTPYIIAITFALTAATLLFATSYSSLLQPVRNLVFDSYQQIKPRQNADSAVVIVDVDEGSIDAIGQWPWSRNDLARMTMALAQAGAMAIGFDMVFSEPDRTNPAFISDKLPQTVENREFVQTVLAGLPDSDETFADAIGQTPTALGFFDLGKRNEEPVRRIAGISWVGEDLSDILHEVPGTVSSLSRFQNRASGQGSISLGAGQRDDIVRSISAFQRVNGEVFPILAIETLRLAIQNATGELQSYLIKTSLAGAEGGSGYAITDARVANFAFPLSKHGALTIYYASNNDTAYLPAKTVLQEPADTWRDQVEGRIVLIGTSAPGLRDIRNTTLREAVPGVAVHAQIIDQIMQGVFLERPDWAQGAEIALAILLTLVIILILPYVGAITSALFGMVIAAIVLAISWFAFDWYGVLFDPAVPLLTALAAWFLTTLLLFAFAEREKRFVRSAFQHYLAPELLGKLEEDPQALKLGGEIRDMTLMFMDVRNFTPISEKLDPQELVTFLNDLLSPLSEIIQKHEGAIDKYIGDSIMAFWNAPLDVEDHPRKACLAALEMLEKVDELNARNAFGFEERGLDPVSIGIGINTGAGCVGNMGSASRFDYSVVGDSVNVAARLESASKDACWPILVSTETAERAPALAFLHAGEIELKGKSRPLTVFALIGNETMALNEPFIRLKEELAKLRGNKRLASGKREKQVQYCLSLAPPHLHAFINR